MDSMSIFHITSAVMWVAGIFTVGGVFLLRPLAKQLGEYLEVLSDEKRRGSPGLGEERVLELLEGFDRRLSQVEDERDFHLQLSSSTEMFSDHLGD
jgi:hypothetical protein